MFTNQKSFQNAQDYSNFVRNIVSLLDQEFTAWENKTRNGENLADLARQMPALISLVNTVGYLRGQDGVFLDFRPKTENQKEFYEYENNFEKRLEKLIDILLASNQKKFYLDRLESYFIKVRSKEPPTVW